MVSVTVTQSKRAPIELKFPGKKEDRVLVPELKSAITAKIPKLVANRQRLSSEGPDGKYVPLTNDTWTLSMYGIHDGAKIRLKDLGAQTDYRNLYLVEYAGVIILNPLFLRFSYLLWGHFQPSSLQLTVRNLTILHFIKRFLESAFIHDFSRPTVPVAYVYRNALYYWGVVGLLQPLTLYRPAYGAKALQGSILNDPRWITFWVAIILICEVLNLNTHIHLRSIRTPPGQPRKYPTAFGFGTAVCANYWFETIGVLSLLALTGFDFGTFVYNVIAIYFMYRWSGQKVARYKKEFDRKIFPGKRYQFLPPLC